MFIQFSHWQRPVKAPVPPRRAFTATAVRGPGRPALRAGRASGLPGLADGPEPDVEAQPDEQQRRHRLRDAHVVVEGALQPVLGVAGDEAQRRAEDAAERAARP